LALGNIRETRRRTHAQKIERGMRG
jgi:hypothetical protein